MSTKNNPEKPCIEKSQIQFGTIVHWITIASCLIALIAPVFILLLPDKNLLNPTLLFNAIFEGKRAAEIWEAAGVSFQDGGFWKLFFGNFFTPDGIAAFAVALGCSVTLWALIPAAWQFGKKKNYFYLGVSFFIMALAALAMSGMINII